MFSAAVIFYFIKVWCFCVTLASIKFEDVFESYGKRLSTCYIFFVFYLQQKNRRI